MSDETLQRIEDALHRLGHQQEQILRRLGRLEGSAIVLDGDEAFGGPRRERVVAFLDRFRAGEALGEISLGAWIAVCDDPGLRGGLRTVQMREGSHARLLAERIKELGSTPRYEIPEEIHSRVMEGSADRDRSDAEKVKNFVSRFPDRDRALAPIHELADQLDDDPETQALLRSIAQDESATLEFFYRACERLCG
jgi:hypothetical protein